MILMHHDGLERDVRQYVSVCDHCQRNKASNEKPAGLLQPLPVPEFRWQWVTVDFITDLPENKAGHTAIVVFVDRLSKMVHFAPCWNNMGAEEFAQIFVREIFRLHGIPKFLVSDRDKPDKPADSKFFGTVCKLLGIDQRMSTASHPQTDGQTERANRTLEDMLRHFINPAQSDWDVRLPCCEFAVNNAWNRATGSTPFFLNYGDHPRTPVNVDAMTPLPAANSFVGRVSAVISSARDSLLNAQRRMSADADKARRDEQFEVGEFVLLSTKFLRLPHVGRKKLLNKYLGPFEIVSRKGAVTYELRLPASMSRMYNVFHVALLRRYKDGCTNPSAPLPAMLPDGEMECEVDKVLAHRTSKTGRRWYYVQWRGLPPEENEWLAAGKLGNAADVVQDYLTELHDKGRPAARVGRPDSAVSQVVEAVSQMDTSDTEPAAVQKPKRGRGRPRKAGKQANNTTSGPVQKRRRGRPKKK